MPFKSEAQRRKFAELVSQGKMKQSTFDEWNKNTPGNLPEKVRKTNEKGPGKKLSPWDVPKSIEELKQIAKRKLAK